jgi:hypothetical protein
MILPLSKRVELTVHKGAFENSLKREISNETAAMIVELARRFALRRANSTIGIQF